MPEAGLILMNFMVMQTMGSQKSNILEQLSFLAPQQESVYEYVYMLCISQNHKKLDQLMAGLYLFFLPGEQYII